MSFRKQMITGYVMLIGLVVATGATGVVALHATNTRLEQVATDVADRGAAVQHLRYLAEEVVSSSRALVFVGDDQAHASFAVATKTFEDELANMHAGLLTAKVEAAARAYVEAAQDAALTRGKVVEVFENRLRPLRAKLENEMAMFVENQRAQVDREAAHDRSLAERFQAVMIIATSIAVVVGVLLAMMVMHRLFLFYARERSATQAAERAAEARQHVLAVVSHDLRSPLGAIVLGASLLAEEVSGDRERRQLAAIRSASDRINSMIELLLESVRMESGTLELKKEAVDVSSLLDQAALLFQARAAAAGIELRVASTPAVAVKVDRERMLQVIANLLGNALKFTPAPGTISIGAERRGGEVAITVSDTGSGISTDQMPKIFDRYWHGERGGGLGLGLHICKQIVEAHGGTISVASQLGTGTTMRLELPVVT